MMITMISPPLEALRVDDDVVARTEVPALDGMARDRHICLYYPPPLAQLPVGPWVTPPSNIVNIPELRNTRCFRKSLLARGP